MGHIQRARMHERPNARGEDEPTGKRQQEPKQALSGQVGEQTDKTLINYRLDTRVTQLSVCCSAHAHPLHVAMCVLYSRLVYVKDDMNFITRVIPILDKQGAGLAAKEQILVLLKYKHQTSPIYIYN
jgi:hypothetical protein